MASDILCTPAWLLVGLTRSVPGVLELADGIRVSGRDSEWPNLTPTIQSQRIVNQPANWTIRGL
jgi:hypothetical protein